MRLARRLYHKSCPLSLLLGAGGPGKGEADRSPRTTVHTATTQDELVIRYLSPLQHLVYVQTHGALSRADLALRTVGGLR